MAALLERSTSKTNPKVNTPTDEQLNLEHKLAAMTAERDELLDALNNGGLPHSCSDQCRRPACVLRRDLSLCRETLKAVIETYQPQD